VGRERESEREREGERERERERDVYINTHTHYHILTFYLVKLGGSSIALVDQYMAALLHSKYTNSACSESTNSVPG
jgi:hypothetical protein